MTNQALHLLETINGHRAKLRGGGKANRLEAALAALAVGQQVVKASGVAKTKWKAWQSRDLYTLVVNDNDPLYEDVQEHLLRILPPVDQRSLTVRFDRDLRNDPVAVLYDGSRTHDVRIAGHVVAVSIFSGRPTGKARTGSDSDDPAPDGGNHTRYDPMNIQFDCDGVVARDAVIGWLAELATARRSRENPPEFNTIRWGGWHRLRFVPRRSIDSVFLPDGQMDRLIADMERFLASRDEYERIGLPWHRGYLLHGPAGTGKTSVAKALATHFNMDMWYLPLGDIPSDTSLINMIAEVRSGGMLLLEDVDVFDAAASRDEKKSGTTIDVIPTASLSGVLNALDGAATPEGLITVMTTNHLAALDPALIRPGRADVVEQIDWLADSQLPLIWGRAFPGVDCPEFPSVRVVDGRGWTPADVFQQIQPHFRDPAAAAGAISCMLAGEPPRPDDSVHAAAAAKDGSTTAG